MKISLAVLAVTALLSAAPMMASADATTTGSDSTLASPLLTSLHEAHHQHHRHHRHRRHHGVSATTGL